MQQPVNIMLVEDEAIIALWLRMELNKAGYSACKIFSTGEDAIKAAAKEKPDLVLMDIQLSSQMNGFEAAHHICELQAVPVIFFTGYPDVELKHKAAEFKSAGYFVKPVNIQELVTAINNLFPDS